MKLLPTVFLSGISTAIGMMCSLVTGKMLAIFVGAAGFAFIGQFINFIQLVQVVAGNVYQQGIIKYSAEYRDDPVFLSGLYQNASALMLSAIFLLFLLIQYFANSLSIFIFHTSSYVIVIRVFAFMLVLFIFNNFFLSILNGLREIKKYVFAQIVGSVFSTLLGVILIFYFKLWGALLSLTLYQGGVFFVTAWLLFKTGKFKFNYLRPVFYQEKLKKLLAFASMSVVAGVAGPLSQLLVLNYLVHHLGPIDTGYWQAMNRLGTAGTAIITTALSVYYIPTLSALKDKKEILKEITHCYKVFMPILAILCLVLWCCRDYIIIILFTKQFEPMRELFMIQLIGVMFQIASWIICNLMWAKAMYRIFIISEVIFVGMFVLLTVLFTNWLGFQGSVLGFCVNYIGYFIFSILLLFFYLKQSCESRH